MVCGGERQVLRRQSHPERRSFTPDLTGRRPVIVGNGNVALDMARILTSGPNTLARTEIAAEALDALRLSKVEEVAIMGRRGPEHPAFTAAELQGLMAVPGVDVIVDLADLVGLPSSPKLDLLREAAATKSTAGNLRVLFRFNAAVRVVADEAAGGLRVDVAFGEQVRSFGAGIVLRAIGVRRYGHRGGPVRARHRDDPDRRRPSDRPGHRRSRAGGRTAAHGSGSVRGYQTSASAIRRRLLPLWPTSARRASVLSGAARQGDESH